MSHHNNVICVKHLVEDFRNVPTGTHFNRDIVLIGAAYCFIKGCEASLCVLQMPILSIELGF